MPRRQTRRRSAEEDRAEVEDRERTNLGSQDRVDTARGRASARLTGAISRNQRAADSNPRKVKEFHPLFRSNRSSASTDFFFILFSAAFFASVAPEIPTVRTLVPCMQDMW